VWAPGDGKTRYRINREGHHVGSYALGASEAYHQFHAMANILERTTAAREGR
jgi:hypothetical protein